MSKTNELGTESILRLLIRYSLPSIVAMVINSIYNIIDRIFIGNYVGEAALGGLAITFPIMMIIFAFATLIGVGGNVLFSISLGQNNKREASKIFTSTIGLCILVSIITILILFFNLDSLLSFFGATDEILSYSVNYMQIILAGFLFQMISFSLINSIRNEGAPVLPMISMIASAIINIVLDYILIYILNWGVEGAALATVLGQFVGFLILVSFYIRGKSIIKIYIKDILPNFKTIREIISIGFASFAGTMGASIALIVLNRAFSQYGGTSAIASMGAVNSLYTLCLMPLMGIQQGMLPILGYNHGAGLKKRVWNTLSIAIIISVIFSIIMFIMLELFANQAVTLFLDNESSTYQIAAIGLRLYILSLPVVTINLLGVAFFQSIADASRSLFLGLLRQFIFLIPLVFILPIFMGLEGVWLSTPIADILAVITTAIILVREYKKDKVEKSQLVLLTTN
ncbi:MAG: MATE family efflux transporter [Pleomorphochaeta sp.]